MARLYFSVTKDSIQGLVIRLYFLITKDSIPALSIRTKDTKVVTAFMGPPAQRG